MSEAEPRVSPTLQGLYIVWKQHFDPENVKRIKRTWKDKFDEQMRDAAKEGRTYVIFPWGHPRRQSLELQFAELAFEEWLKETGYGKYTEGAVRFRKQNEFEGDHNEIAWRVVRIQLAILMKDVDDAMTPKPAPKVEVAADASKSPQPANKVEEVV